MLLISFLRTRLGSRFVPVILQDGVFLLQLLNPSTVVDAAAAHAQRLVDVRAFPFDEPSIHDVAHRGAPAESIL